MDDGMVQECTDVWGSLLLTHHKVFASRENDCLTLSNPHDLSLSVIHKEANRKK